MASDCNSFDYAQSGDSCYDIADETDRPEYLVCLELGAQCGLQRVVAGLLSFSGDVNILHMYLHGIVVASRQDRWIVPSYTEQFGFFVRLQ